MSRIYKVRDPKTGQFMMKSDKMDVSIRIRMCREEKDILLSYVSATNISLSEFIRRRALGRQVMSYADQKIISALSKIGILLKRLSLKSGQVDDEKSWKMLQDIRYMFTYIRKEIEKKEQRIQ